MDHPSLISDDEKTLMTAIFRRAIACNADVNYTESEVTITVKMRGVGTAVDIAQAIHAAVLPDADLVETMAKRINK